MFCHEHENGYYMERNRFSVLNEKREAEKSVEFPEFVPHLSICELLPLNCISTKRPFSAQIRITFPDSTLMSSVRPDFTQNKLFFYIQ